MDGETPDAQKNDHENEDSLMNVNPSSEYGLSKVKKLVYIERATTHIGFGQRKVVISSSPSKDHSQGTLQFTMSANGSPCFVFKLENQKDVYVASLSNNIVKDQSVLDYSYMIHLQRGEPSSHLVGRVKVTSLLLNERTIERQFVLFGTNGEHPQIQQCRKKNRGFSKKVVDVIRNNQSISSLRRSWDEQLQEPRFENKFPTNLETLAVVVKEESLEEEIGGWGLKFLKKSRLVQTNDATETETETSSSLISMDVVIPSGIHGGPEDGPLSLIERWKSEGNCDCEGWDLGCSLTILRGQAPKDHCNHLELFEEENETPGVRIVNGHGGFYFVQFHTKISVLQSFSIALAFIHSQKLRH
ncbi:unnamed protein product [Arabis nemorensis]|uniref:Uncharacterized protein n=1 Tax=Arabis nemorensis TaxID=586526 RepID=A0A565AMT9_9BRAS|nr:unnamed protein product [Arabis nemorensis]